MFGTVLNRMVIQAVLGHPLTVYGNGSQTRGLINIVDTVECIRLASENPADRGEFRVFNQMTESLSINQIAETIADEYPGEVTIEHVENPRVEIYDHYYNGRPHGARGPRPEADAAVDDADRPPVRRRRALQGPRRPGRDPADRQVGGDHERAAPHRERAGPSEVTASALGARSPGAQSIAGRRVLVTGGSGFIGRHVVSELTADGAQVRVVDLKPHPDPAVDIVIGDIADREVLERALDGGFDSIVHLAAVTSVLRSLEHPELHLPRPTSPGPRTCSRPAAPPA